MNASSNTYSFLDKFPEGYQVISPEFTYVYVNDAVVAQGKSKREVLLGSTMMKAYPGIEKTNVFEAIKVCMETRQSSSMLNEFTFPDGTVGVFELRMRPVEDGVMIISEEVTERERKIAESKTLFDSMVGREKKIIELKEEINQLKNGK